MDNIEHIQQFRAYNSETPLGFFKYELVKSRVKINNITRTQFNLKLAKLKPNSKVALARKQKALSSVPGGALISKIFGWFTKDDYGNGNK